MEDKLGGQRGLVSVFCPRCVGRGVFLLLCLLGGRSNDRRSEVFFFFFFFFFERERERLHFYFGRHSLSLAFDFAASLSLSALPSQAHFSRACSKRVIPACA